MTVEEADSQTSGRQKCKNTTHKKEQRHEHNLSSPELGHAIQSISTHSVSGQQVTELELLCICSPQQPPQLSSGLLLRLFQCQTTSCTRLGITCSPITPTELTNTRTRVHTIRGSHLVGPHMIRIWIAWVGGIARTMRVAGGHGVAVGVVRVLEFVISHGSSLLGSKVLNLRDRRTACHLVVRVQKVKLTISSPRLKIYRLLER